MDSKNEPSEDRDSLLSTFCGITGCENERAQFYLESANWNLNLATQAFFDHSEDELPPQQPMTFPMPTQIQQPVDISDNETNEPKSSGPTATSSSRFGTLDSLRKNEKSDDEEGQAFYAGGSTRSGQQVLGPKKNKKDLVKEVFDMAKEHGAEIVDKNEESSRSKHSTVFQGAGFRLGNDGEASSTAIQSHNQSQNQRPRHDVILKMWTQGFTVNDGPIRDYRSPENQQFIDAIKRGQIPPELISQAQGGEVHLDMEDHLHEDYVEPKKKVQAFTGEGHRLGSAAPDLIVLQQDSTDTKNSETEAQNSLNVDQSKPITTIQVRLADGSRLIIKLNLTHTISAIRNYICVARPSHAGVPFVLMTTFPNKELTDESLTIQDANLANACIVQRFK